MAIGTGLESRTNCDQASTYFNKSVGEAISFLDTTGFKQALPDNWRTVNKSRVSLFLVTRYKAKIPLLGILYLHPVADEPTNKALILKILSELGRNSGGNIVPRVSFITMMWDDVDDVKYAKGTEAKLN
ncbi:hypothetical protein J3A83DRAFT_1642321 [Scleroderma citrinum]